MQFIKSFRRAALGSALASSIGATALIAMGATMGTVPAAAQVTPKPSSEIVLSIGRGQLVTLPGNITDLFIADDKIADVQVKSARQLYVFGKAGGETTLYASNAAGQVVYSTTIRVGSNIDSIDQMLTLAMPEADINVSTMNGLVLLTGTIAAPGDAAEAERLVQAFVGDETEVISRLKTATPLQVNLQVKIAEVSRSLVKNIGANLLSGDSTNGFQFGVTNGRTFSPQFTPGGPVGTGVTAGGEGTTVITGIGDGGTTLAGLGNLFGLDLAGTLDLAETVGLVTTLSQPNLTALSGETAEFLAGGEFPIPIAQGLGNVAIQFRSFGVSLAYTPTVLENGRISLRVRPEVSELSASGAVNLQGFSVPGLTIRSAETTVELGSGQSFMIAGLMSNNIQNSVNKAPGLGDVPILGNLFKSSSFQKGETELVIVVTPYLVKPVNSNDIKLPTDAFRTANDVQRLLINQETDGISGGDRPKPSVEQPTRDVRREQMIGQQSQAPRPNAAAPQTTSRASRDANPGFTFE
ncbi:type II and III secretion system protein family protein [Alterisphingorhabdus coralli]|uniref:Type II and III secretion system protein family protein n=1 Tax=Alterisphingorhabdus coralli TaxID=3071408 RepID=A0AA97F701_9SPHN|nr:type II and III secretion system protein family protein [Parasphingorhabdus sp. SCSIO 66989]WOE74616.1 type II and III secretion system protein family protein [Parasphingorhabdus sp. SCSIO 66989]